MRMIEFLVAFAQHGLHGLPKALFFVLVDEVTERGCPLKGRVFEGGKGGDFVFLSGRFTTLSFGFAFRT